MPDGAFIPIGTVVKTHGLKGELSIRLERDIREIPVGLHVWFVPPPGGARQGVVERVRRGPKGPLVSVSGISDVSAAETLRGSQLVARPQDLPPDVHVHVAARIGLRVVDATRGDLGTIVSVIETGANDVWVVRGGPFGEVLVPVIDDVVIELDEEAGVCRVELLPGLIEGEP